MTLLALCITTSLANVMASIRLITVQVHLISKALRKAPWKWFNNFSLRTLCCVNSSYSGCKIWGNKQTNSSCYIKCLQCMVYKKLSYSPYPLQLCLIRRGLDVCWLDRKLCNYCKSNSINRWLTEKHTVQLLAQSCNETIPHWQFKNHLQHKSMDPKQAALQC